MRQGLDRWLVYFEALLHTASFDTATVGHIYILHRIILRGHLCNETKGSENFYQPNDNYKNWGMLWFGVIILKCTAFTQK